MKNILITLLLLGFLLPAYAQKTRPVPVIDIKAASNNRKPVKLSEIVRDIEYLNLKLPLPPSTKWGQERVIAGNHVIVLKSSYYQKIFILDRQGNFIRSFGEIGNKPWNFKNIGLAGSYPNWDLSPDEKTIIVQDETWIKMFRINGEFLGSAVLPSAGCKFFFLDNDHIIVKKTLQSMAKDGNQIFIYDNKLQLTDSLYLAKSPGPRPVPVGQPAMLPNDDFYKLRGKIYFRPASHDTLFEISPDLKLKPVFAFDFGELKAPLKWQTRDDVFRKNINVDYLVETADYLIADLNGPMRKDSLDDEYRTLVYNKINGDYFITKRLSSHPDSAGYYEGIIDDMDGLGFYSFQYSGDKNVTLIDRSYIKNISSDNANLTVPRDPRSMEKLKSVLEKTEPNSLAIRILHYDKPRKQRVDRNLNLTASREVETLNIKPVRTSHEWPGADWLSDVTYDPTDDTFWSVKMPKIDTIEHRSRNGEKLPGTFPITDPTNIEGITVSTVDQTLWLADAYGGYILHYDRQGKKLDDGFPMDPKYIFGIAFDPSDSTLWMMETEKSAIWHYTTSGKKLGSINVLHSGCNDGRGLAYDPRDNSLWIVNASPNKMIHVNKQGDELPGSFYFDISLGLPDGVALDQKNYEFWIGDWGAKRRAIK